MKWRISVVMEPERKFGGRDYLRHDAPDGTHVALHGDEYGGLAAVLLQQLAGEHPAAGPGSVLALGPDDGPQFAQGTLPPGQEVRSVDHRPNGRRRFTVRDGEIVTLMVIRNTPVAY